LQQQAIADKIQKEQLDKEERKRREKVHSIEREEAKKV